MMAMMMMVMMIDSMIDYEWSMTGNVFHIFDMFYCNIFLLVQYIVNTVQYIMGFNDFQAWASAIFRGEAAQSGY